MKGGLPQKLSTLLQPAIQIGEIRPPQRTLDDLERYLREIAPLVVQDEEGRPTPFGLAIYRWKIRIADARKAGLSYSQAEQHWKAAIEREDAALRAATDYQARHADRALRERNAAKSGPRSKQRYGADTDPADELFAYAEDAIPR